MHAGADPAPHREYIAQLVGGQASAVRWASKSSSSYASMIGLPAWADSCAERALTSFPQLWNVLRGDMSLVGPRPVVPYELEHYSCELFNRFAVKPGLTGLWQVSGRNEKTYTEMVELDVEYVETRSLRLDLLILIKTVGVVVETEGCCLMGMVPARIGAAVVGYGYWGPNLLRNLVGRPEFELHALCELNESRAAQFLGRYPDHAVEPDFDESCATLRCKLC